MNGSININLRTTPVVPVTSRKTTGALSEWPAAPQDGLHLNFSAPPEARETKTRPELTATPSPVPSSAPALTSPKEMVAGGVALAAADGGLTVSRTGGLADLGALTAPAFSSGIDDFLVGLVKSTPTPVVTPNQIDWNTASEVVSGAQKFILPVPKFEGEPLVYPAGAKDKNGQEIGGIPICDWQGQPIGDKGVVFFNQKDNAWQAVKSDGQGVVIMNQVNEDQAKKLMEKVGGDPAKLSLEQFRSVLEYANSDAVGCRDMYNSDRGFISSKMNPLETHSTGIPHYGLFRRDDRDVCKAVFVEGPAEFEAPTTGGILVKQEITSEGGILLRQPDGKTFLYRKIDNTVFCETYRHKDGAPVQLNSLAKFSPQNG